MSSNKLRQHLEKVMGITLVSVTLTTGCIAPPAPGAEKSTLPDQTTAAVQPGATVNGDLYTDPTGRFSAPIPTNWTATAAEGHVVLRDPGDEIRVYLLALDNPDPEATIKVEDEKVLSPIAPAGTHWSTLEDMTNYLIMALNKGVTVDGVRVVSEENLLTTWQPQVPLSADASYGLGWFVSDYKGAPLMSHGGNTLGFTSDFAFLPEHGLGIVMLANARGTNYFNFTLEKIK